MKKLIMLILMLAPYFVYAKSKTDIQITLSESSCIDYYNGLIERKLGDDKSPEARKKWEEMFLTDYRFAKDTQHPEQERLKAIEQANLVCNVQQRMKL